MAYKKKTWAEKLADDKDLPRKFRLEGDAAKKWGRGTMVIARPRDVDALMKRVPKGRVVTINELRTALARQHGTTVACPITTGIFAWIAAHAAAESGAKKATPYWRTLKNGGEVNAKYPGGLNAACRQLRAEGHKIETRGKRRFVAGFEKSLVELTDS